MTRSALTEVKLEFSSVVKNTLDDGQVASLVVGQPILSGRMTSGIASGETNRAWENRGITISSGATLDIDLYDFAGQDIGAGDGRDGLGQTLTLEEVVCLIIKNASATGSAGQLEIMPSSPAGALTWVPAQTVANGGALKPNGTRMFFLDDADAFEITDASSHVLRLGANGGDVTVDIFVAGRHDDGLSTSTASSTSTLSSSTGSSSTTSSLSGSTDSTLSSSTSSTLSSSSTSTQSSSSTSTQSSSTLSSSSTENSSSSSSSSTSTQSSSTQSSSSVSSYSSP